MKKEYPFPERWKILITKENFDIVTPYYSKVSSCYTDPNDAIGEWIRSHNHSDQHVLEDDADASFFGKETDYEFETITTEQFQEYILNQKIELEDMSYLIPLIKNLDNGN
jgi:hypothetical protein